MVFTLSLYSLIHDLAHNLDFAGDDPVQCCDKETGNFVEPKSNGDKSVCFPIKIPPLDKLQGDKNCINFVRSCGAPRIDCKSGPKEQLNQITHWLDASNVYGSTDQASKTLRAEKDGLLRVIWGLYSNIL